MFRLPPSLLLIGYISYSFLLMEWYHPPIHHQQHDKDDDNDEYLLQQYSSLNNWNNITLSSSSNDQNDHNNNNNNNNNNNVLLVGLLYSIEELSANPNVIQSIERLCIIYNHNLSIDVVYGSDPLSTKFDLVERFNKAGCLNTVFTHQDDLLKSVLPTEVKQEGTKKVFEEFTAMNRFERLAMLRSLQRKQIINDNKRGNNNYQVIVNMDLDILQFSLPALINTIQTTVIRNSNNNISTTLCANGYETWTLLPSMFGLKVYYDTFASVDSTGTWWYRYYATPLNALDQLIVVPRILLSSSSINNIDGYYYYPMESCFGGIAVYDYKSWSKDTCDYIQNNKKEETTVTTSIQNYKTNDGNVCEHVVLQQCILLQQKQKSNNNNNNVILGIRPDLFVEREPETITLIKIRIIVFVIICTVIYGLFVLFPYRMKRIIYNYNPRRLLRLRSRREDKPIF